MYHSLQTSVRETNFLRILQSIYDLIARFKIHVRLYHSSHVGEDCSVIDDSIATLFTAYCHICMYVTYGISRGMSAYEVEWRSLR